MMFGKKLIILHHGEISNTGDTFFISFIYPEKEKRKYFTVFCTTFFVRMDKLKTYHKYNETRLYDK